jgi:hypothetical protein
MRFLTLCASTNAGDSVLQSIKSALGLASTKVMSTDSTRQQAGVAAGLAADSNNEALEGVVSNCEYRPAAEHATALLVWLQGPGGRTGTVLARDLKGMHADLCVERDWEPLKWDSVGRELRRLIGGRKEYIPVGKQRLCAYRIPPRMRHSRPAPAERKAA